MKRFLPALSTCALSALLSTASLAGESCKGDAALKQRAKITCEQARKTALAKVGSGRIKGAEIEEENGKLIYSFDIKKQKTSGIEEVQVDAVSGAIVSVEHEGRKQEAAEKAADKADVSK